MRLLLENLLAPRSAFRLGVLALLMVLALLLLPRPALAATFPVTKTADTNDGNCDADCSLREAIVAANAAAGPDTITLGAGTFTLTRVGVDNTAANGDLDVTGPLTINGAGQGSTFIEAGASSSTAIDRVFSFNPAGLAAGFAVSLNNLTIRHGKNPNAFATFESDGGCFDFDGGTSGLGSLSLSSVTVSSCETTDGNGGGVAVFLPQGGTVNFTGITVQSNIASRGGTNFGSGGGLAFFCVNNGATANVIIANSTISGNTTRSLGGNNQGSGGGLFFFGACSGTPTLNYQLRGVTISGNSAGNDGGGIWSTANLTIDNTGGATVISNNSSGRSGGGIWLNHINRTTTISKVTISGNSAVDGGGGIRLDSASPGNNLTLSFSRIVNNTAGSGKATGLSVYNGAATATNNWWGCSTGPSASPCDTAKLDPASGTSSPLGTGSVNFTPWLRLTHTASPNPIFTGAATTLTASFLTNSDNIAVAASNLTALVGVPITFNGAVLGAISGAQATIQSNGNATATFTAGGTPGAGSANATVDSQTVTANITIQTPPDTTPPSVVSINLANPSPTNAASINFTVTFNESVTGVDAADFALTTTGVSGASITSVTGSGATRTVTVNTGSGDGTIRLDLVDNDSIIDGASNPLGGAGAGNGNFTTGEVYTIDKTGPSVTINQAAGQADPTPNTPINFTVVFNEAVTNFATGDVTLSGTAPGTLVATVTGSGTTYNVAVSGMTGGGTVIASIAVGVATDALGNGNSASTSGDDTVTFVVDSTAPTVVSITRADPNPTNAAAVNFTVTFNESVTGVDAADFSLNTTGVSGASITGVSGSGATRTVTVNTGSGDGTIRLDLIDNDTIIDGAGNPLGGSGTGNGSFTTGEVYTIDKTGPSVTINQAAGQADPTPNTPINFEVIFNESVNGFTNSDVNLSASTAPGTLVATVTGGPTAYNVAVSGMTGGGDVIVSIPANAATDAAGNNSAAATIIDNTVTFVVNAAPVVTTQPTNQTVCAGSTVSFSAAASGNPPPTVQWQVSTDNGGSWSDLSGETNLTLSFTANAADNGKQYRAVFTNSVSSANSNAATLTVNTAPAISTQPSSQTVNAGQSVSFSAAASGSPAPTVQWQVSPDSGATWSDLTGETATTLTFTAQSGDNGKQYRAIFTNSCGTATTNPATLTVNTPQPDLTVTKTNNVSGATTVGNAWDWQIDVSNSGGADASFSNGQTILSDNLPDANITYGTASVSNVTGVTGNISCNIVSNNLTCTASGGAVTIAASGSFRVTVTATPSAAGTFVNPRSAGSCAVDPDNQVTESNEGNNSCADTVTVTVQPVSDLTISKSHAGNFAQGAPGTYILVVSNSGTGSSSGTVTVVDILPSGLTAVGLSGDGWTCDLGTLTCTRSDALAAGSSYPNILLVVHVASNAPASVTNSATVSGGGEQNTTNNTANDPTTVNSAPPPTPVLLISSNENGSVPSVAYRDEDIIAYSNGVWSMVFDGSNVGLGNNDIDDFAILPSGEILLSVEKDFTLSGVGPVGDEDILKFTPTALGAATAGTWSIYFDGSDVGLDANKDDEDIKALDLDGAGKLVISVRGKFDALGVKGDDKDLFTFTFTGAPGPNTSGSWAVRFDGSDIKLKEDLRSVWLDNGAGELYLTVEDDFSVTGNRATPPPNVTVKGDENDIFICKQTGIGANTICDVRFYLDVGSIGLGKREVDGLSIGALPTVQVSTQVTGSFALDDTVEFQGDDVDEAADPDEEQEAGYSLFLSVVVR